MTDLTKSVGFEIPSYDDFMQKISESNNEKLQKAATILQTAALSHSLLSNFKTYRDMTKSLAENVFDPVTMQVKEGLSSVIGKLPVTPGEGENSALSSLLKSDIVNPSDLVNIIKQPKASLNTIAKRALKKVELPEELAQGKITAKSAKQLVNKAIAETDIIPDEAKQLSQSILSDGKAPLSAVKELVGKGLADNLNLPDDIKDFTSKLISGGKLPGPEDAKLLASKIADNADVPNELKGLINQLAEGQTLNKQSIQAALKTVISNNDLVPAQLKGVVNNAIDGKTPSSQDIKGLANELLPDDIKAQLPDLEGLTELSAIPGKAAVAGDIKSMTEGLIKNKVQELGANTVERLKNSGLSVPDIVGNPDKVSAYQKILDEAPKRFLDPGELTADAPDIGLSDAINTYKQGNLFKLLQSPGVETGLGPGQDSTIARALSGTLGKSSGEVVENTVKQLKTSIRGYTPIKSKAELKASLQELKQKGKQAVSQQLESEQFGERIGINTDLGELAQQASSISTGDFVDKLKSSLQQQAPAEEGEGESVLQKVTGKLKQGVEDSVEADESPIGDIVTGGLEIAALATQLASLFEKPKTETPEVSGYQVGI